MNDLPLNQIQITNKPPSEHTRIHLPSLHRSPHTVRVPNPSTENRNTPQLFPRPLKPKFPPFSPTLLPKRLFVFSRLHKMHITQTPQLPKRPTQRTPRLKPIIVLDIIIHTPRHHPNSDILNPNRLPYLLYTFNPKSTSIFCTSAVLIRPFIHTGS